MAQNKGLNTSPISVSRRFVLMKNTVHPLLISITHELPSLLMPAPVFATLVFQYSMLKIGSVRWRGKCAKHPGFDPALDGPGGVKGNCQRCNDLVVIHDLHQKALRLMRTFRPAEEKKTAPNAEVDDRQMGLFV